MSPVKAAAAACQITNFSKLKTTASSNELLLQNNITPVQFADNNFEVDFFKSPTSQRLLNYSTTASNELPSPPLQKTLY